MQGYSVVVATRFVVPEKFGQFDSLVTFADNVGNQMGMQRVSVSRVDRRQLMGFLGAALGLGVVPPSWS